MKRTLAPRRTGSARTTKDDPPPEDSAMDDAHDPGASEDASSDDDAHMDPAIKDPDAADADSSDDNDDRELTCYFYRAVLGFNRPASIALWTDQGLRTERDFLRLKPNKKHWQLMNPDKTLGSGPPRNCHVVSP